MATLDTTAPVARPPEMSGNPVRRVAGDLWEEWRGRGEFPPCRADFSWAPTPQIAHAPLPLLLSAYQHFGPHFHLPLLPSRVVFMLGPASNQLATVSSPHS